MRHLSLFALLLAIAMSSALAGVAPNSGASSMSQSGAKVAPAKAAAEEKKEHHEHGKQSQK